MRHRPLGPALIALAAALNAGCLAAWPAADRLSDPHFASGALPVDSIDVLPLDLQVWSDGRRDPAPIAVSLTATAGVALAAELDRRGYAVARIGRDGSVVAADGRRHVALPPEQLGQTMYALSSYGVAVAKADGELLAPFLPHRLGTETGADATLHVAGWAFAGERPKSALAEVAKVLLIVTVVAVVVVAVIAASDGKLGGGAELAGRAVVTTARVAGRVVGGVLRGAGRLAWHAGRAVLRSDLSLHLVVDSHAGPVELTDAFGRPRSHIEVVAARPDYHAAPGAPRVGRSRMMLELTLIDNRSGRALWHARGAVNADPTRPDDVRRAVRHMLVSMPER